MASSPSLQAFQGGIEGTAERRGKFCPDRVVRIEQMTPERIFFLVSS